jgi:hypothetical protein
MENSGPNPDPMPNKPDILDAIANAAEDFQLTAPVAPPQPGRAEEEVLLKVLNRIIEQNRKRATRHSKEGILQCFTIKVPAHELQALRLACGRHEIYMTDIARFLMLAVIRLLDAPTEKVRPLLDQIREEVEARRAKAKARENPQVMELAS